MNIDMAFTQEWARDAPRIVFIWACPQRLRKLLLACRLLLLIKPHEPGRLIFNPLDVPTLKVGIRLIRHY
jgi:hypothetical protein